MMMTTSTAAGMACHMVYHARTKAGLVQQTPSFGPDQGLLVACASSFFDDWTC